MLSLLTATLLLASPGPVAAIPGPSREVLEAALAHLKAKLGPKP